jgi:hypothetical protein
VIIIIGGSGSSLLMFSRSFEAQNWKIETVEVSSEAPVDSTLRASFLVGRIVKH